MTPLRSALPAIAGSRRRRRLARAARLLVASVSLLTACVGSSAAAPAMPVVAQAATPTSAPGSSAAAAPTDASSTSSGTSPLPAPVNALGDAGATTTVLNPGVVSWVHLGDLHITTADQQNYQDFQTIIANTNQYLKNGVNFALLPGDNANDDTEAEYQLIKQATDQLQVPLYAIPGDHDEKGGLTFYNKYLEPNDYYSFSAGGYHFAFIDVMSGISDAERSWLTADLDTAAQQGLKNVVFMHSMALASQIQDLIQRDDVIMVDSGHTHYNDVANDGHTIYAAGRNTGQVTEGPVGFEMVTLDNGVVSWKFKPLGSWPFVMITSPSDKQLMIDGSQVVHGTADIRAKIWDDKGVASATMQVDGGTPVDLQRIGDTQMWRAPFDSTQVPDGDHQVKVNVQGAGGNTTEDTITVTVSQAGSVPLPQRAFGPSGNDLGAYVEKGLLGNHTAGGPGGGGKAAPGGGAGGPGGGRGGKNGAAPASGQPAPPNATPPTSDGSTPPATDGSASAPVASSADPATAGNPTSPAVAGPPAGPTAAGAGQTGAGGPRPRGGPSGKAGPGGGGLNAAQVVRVNGTQLTLKLADGTQQTVQVGTSTQVVKESTGTLSDLQPGQTVDVTAQPAGAAPSGSAGTPGASGATASIIEIHSGESTVRG